MPKTKQPLTAEEQLERLRSAGLEVRAEGAGWIVQKGKCVAKLEAGTVSLRVASRAGILAGNEVVHLMDGGFQKFLVGPTRKLPATAEHLRELHAFQEVLGEALGLDTLYNEALGTVSETYHYDRVKGRPNP